jgi:hypothetical protein
MMGRQWGWPQSSFWPLLSLRALVELQAVAANGGVEVVAAESVVESKPHLCTLGRPIRYLLPSRPMLLSRALTRPVSVARPRSTSGPIAPTCWLAASLGGGPISSSRC